jgi:hypothetical protein
MPNVQRDRRLSCRLAAFVLCLCAAAPGLVAGQGRQGGAPAQPNLNAPEAPPPEGAPAPPPRSLDGRIRLGPAPGERGVWMPVFPFGGHLTPLEEVPFQPWARTLYDERLAHQLEPHARCKASGGSRQMQTPYGIDLVDLPELRRIYIFDIGGPHSYRTVHMDGRSHPAHLQPSPFGHSVGWWEGDTLVIDTVGYDEGFWVDRRGLPSTEKLHTLERLTRRVFDTIAYEITIDDPGAYTRPFSGTFPLRLDPRMEVFEYMCQEANYAGELMVGKPDATGETPPVVP